MILSFEKERRVAPVERIGPVLSDLLAYWEYSKEGEALPLSEHLFLSDLMQEMPHLMLAYLHEGQFQIEFAGASATALFGTNPMGATSGPGQGLPSFVAGAIRSAAESRSVQHAAEADMRLLCLPFRGRADAVDLVLIAVTETASEHVAEVVSLVR